MPATLTLSSIAGGSACLGAATATATLCSCLASFGLAGHVLNNNLWATGVSGKVSKAAAARTGAVTEPHNRRCAGESTG